MDASTVQTLQSEWQGLSPFLIASFWQVDRKGNPVNVDANGNTVAAGMGGKQIIVNAPLSESSLDVTLNWVSPFEGAGAEKSFPTLLAMLESGSVQPIVDAIKGLNGGNSVNSSVDSLNNNVLKQFQGKTGITKLNSIQVFTGMPPLKFSVTAVFRAWKDPVTEVVNPVDQLMKWALPVSLSGDSTLISNLIKTAGASNTGLVDWINAILPSTGPVLIAMKYKGRVFSPMVIESIAYPLNSPIDANGNFVELAIPMQICSLAAIDRADWKNTTQ